MNSLSVCVSGLITAPWHLYACQGHDLRRIGQPSGHQLTAENDHLLHLRVRREAPNIQGEPDGVWIVITCRTVEANSASSIFLHCPARSGPRRREGKDSAALSECYQNCAPMEPCRTDTEEACVPDGRSINCSQKPQISTKRECRGKPLILHPSYLHCEDSLKSTIPQLADAYVRIDTSIRQKLYLQDIDFH
ncbi:unnamed protein product [Dibothriocephalus latus]|uniref:Uncharacterized protein n=1 Tax=Dibothriocephalus latus TaxID=60516 RepID=A0A3P7LXS1_DIBLA|nr:unnamed protein product [Dibothriocephalus latus]